MRSTAALADPRQDGSVKLEQIAQAKSLRTPLLPALPFPSSAATTTLSPAARLIDHWLQAAEQAHQPREVTGSAPLLPTPEADPAHLPEQLAPRLQQALEGSGLFYEAHLRQWANGERSLTQIQQEPQNQVAPDPSHDASVQPGQWVPLQLDTLEQNRFAWQGELWPGQTMQWEVRQERKRERQGGAPSGEPAPAWQTVLKLELPELGKVNASIRLEGGRAQLQLQAERPNSATTLQAEHERLVEALAAAGTTLDGFLVKADGQA